MPKRIFRFLRKKEAENDAAIIILEENLLQSFAEANYGRELSDIELNRIAVLAWDNEKVFWWISEIMNSTIETIADEQNDNWDNIDLMFLNRLNKKERKLCLQEHKELSQLDLSR